MPIDLRAEARRQMPAVPHMPHLIASARATWRGRMVNEYASSRVFAALADQMEAAGLGRQSAAACRQFAAEEREHGVLCGSVVEALGGEALAEDRDDAEFPLHPRVHALVGVLRNVVSISCMAETVAVSLIGAERLEMPAGPLRTLLTKIWADEVGHARFGWKLVAGILPGMRAEQRAQVAAYLDAAFAHLEAHELAHIAQGARPPKEGAALGLCNGADARELFYATVNETIVPGLEAIGLPAHAAWNRVRQAA